MTETTVFDTLRPAMAGPLPGLVLALNEANKTHTSELDRAGLDALLSEAAVALAAPGGEGFVIAFGPGASYASPNYRWFAARYPAFLYVDRIVVSDAARGQGLGRALYGAVFAAAAAAGHGLVTCEVNREPPNPGSDAFHAALGFVEVGRGTPHHGKLVRYLARGPAAPVRP